jgi:uncharacterized membrane protein
MTGLQFATHIALATVVMSWLVLHTVYALHYALLFYREVSPSLSA